MMAFTQWVVIEGLLLFLFGLAIGALVGIWNGVHIGKYAERVRVIKYVNLENTDLAERIDDGRHE